MSDIILTSRGKMIPDRGELPSSNDRSVLLEQYLRAAILDALDDRDLNINREVRFRDPDQIGDVTLEIQRKMINIILSTPFGDEFDPSLFKVELEAISDEGLTIITSYPSTNNKEVTNRFELKGGAVILDIDDNIAYTSEYSITLLDEELPIEVATDLIEVSTIPDGFAVVATSDVNTEEIQIEKALSDIPDEERHVIIISVSDNLEINDVSTPISEEVELGLSTSGYIEDSEEEIFLRDLDPTIESDEVIIDIIDNNDSIMNITYVEEARDYLLSFRDPEPIVNITYEKVKAYANAIDIIVKDPGHDTDITRYAYTSDSIRSARLIRFDTVLEPGLYVVYYRARIQNGFNGSLDEDI